MPPSANLRRWARNRVSDDGQTATIDSLPHYKFTPAGHIIDERSGGHVEESLSPQGPQFASLSPTCPDASVTAPVKLFILWVSHGPPTSADALRRTRQLMVVIDVRGTDGDIRVIGGRTGEEGGWLRVEFKRNE